MSTPLVHATAVPSTSIAPRPTRICGQMLRRPTTRRNIGSSSHGIAANSSTDSMKRDSVLSVVYAHSKCPPRRLKFGFATFFIRRKHRAFRVLFSSSNSIQSRLLGLPPRIPHGQEKSQANRSHRRQTHPLSGKRPGSGRRCPLFRALLQEVHRKATSYVSRGLLRQRHPLVRVRPPAS